MSCSTSIAWSVNSSRLFACVNCFAYRLLCITIFNCSWLHQKVVCQVCRAIVRDFGWLLSQSVSGLINFDLDLDQLMLLILFSQSFSWAVQAAIIFWGDKWLRIYIRPPPGSPMYIAKSSGSTSRPSSIAPLQWKIYSTTKITPLGGSHHCQQKIKCISSCWRPESQALLCLVGRLSRHCSTLWLPPRLLLIELRILLIAPSPRLGRRWSVNILFLQAGNQTILLVWRRLYKTLRTSLFEKLNKYKDKESHRWVTWL